MGFKRGEGPKFLACGGLPGIKKVADECGGHVVNTARALGISYSTFCNRWMVNHPVIKEYMDEARKKKAVKEVIVAREKRQASELRKGMTVHGGRTISVPDLEAALIEFGGDEGRCADEFGVHLVTVRRLVRGSQRLQRAKEEGREVAQARIEDHLYAEALAGEKGTKMRAMELIAKAKMDWTTTKKLEHGGSMKYDVDTLPKELEEPDVPDLKVVNLDAALSDEGDD